MDFDNDLLLRDVNPRKIGDRYGKSCCIFATALTMFNIVLYGTVFILADVIYDKEVNNLDSFVDGTFLQNETATKGFLQKLETAVDLICEDIGC